MDNETFVNPVLGREVAATGHNAKHHSRGWVLGWEDRRDIINTVSQVAVIVPVVSSINCPELLVREDSDCRAFFLEMAQQELILGQPGCCGGGSCPHIESSDYVWESI